MIDVTCSDAHIENDYLTLQFSLSPLNHTLLFGSLS